MICAFFSREDHLWNAYSINGQFLTDLSKAKERQSAARILNEDCSHIVSPLVVKDTYSMDKLVYGTERGSIILRTLPSLQRFRRLPVSQEHPVLTVLISPDRRFLHVAAVASTFVQPFDRECRWCSSSSVSVPTAFLPILVSLPVNNGGDRRLFSLSLSIFWHHR